MKQQDKYCGECCYLMGEDTDGYGLCYRRGSNGIPNTARCSDKACSRYVSEQRKRDHIATLIRANRWRRDPHVPAIYRMPDPTALGRAIDFAVEYLKTM
jgi:hypothetical protein